MLVATQRPTKLETLREMNESLQSVQRSLNDHLESKRAAFPLFHYLSNDQLLSLVDIVSQAPEPRVIMSYIKSMATEHPIGTTQIQLRSGEMRTVPKYCECCVFSKGEKWRPGCRNGKAKWKAEPPRTREAAGARKDRPFKLYTQAQLIDLVCAAAIGC